ncbi:hypothetical protein PVAP13_3NG144200 [Panicum virgatum]|uniref:Uncharacterized protein n=1 Tax=Panicum virgatum TaxID=38727 RepID=A0A8T0UB20_PANVG|nr:hypothetical protein PVAP13_3NG144200 [Panicum virgatum]
MRERLSSNAKIVAPYQTRPPLPEFLRPRAPMPGSCRPAALRSGERHARGSCLSGQKGDDAVRRRGAAALQTRSAVDEEVLRAFQGQRWRRRVQRDFRLKRQISQTGSRSFFSKLLLR